ncbi:MAG: FAD/NAD(P)-binding protein [Microbacterium sp.]|uniref:FAD/NAD(P)-binding protein n=1 Tax=Microbacterium sp. TaxID=51671 RepID=UPI001AC59506|nr:FAD/NAD(P)-binding protein [Microbacterium sp.]MBN9178428.1 FAD/NAD(P)-binding protein [Microbacterium sp.]
MNARLVVIGGGPRAAMLLERIVARASDGLAPSGLAVEVDVVDPHPFGAGRIWRRAQSALLKLNSMAQDVTVFTDDTCRIDGPIVPGPSLIEWVEAWRRGELPDVEIDDELVRAEATRLAGSDFPTRRLQSSYLAWFARRVRASAPSGVVIRARQDAATAVRRERDGWRVQLASGAVLDADAVVYAVGHHGSAPDASVADLVERARTAGLHYVPPAFTADLDLEGIPPGADVIVRGMGLAAVDLVVLLTQGRGGLFERVDGRLRYVASGREPRLHLGSRRGVPYRSKVSSRLHGDAPQRDVLTPDVIAALSASDAPPLDFDRDVWPLIASELLHGHYRELFTGHPDRVRGTWDDARRTLSRHAWDDPGLQTAIAALVPDPLDRLDIGDLDRPFGAPEDGARAARFDSADDAHDAVVAHIRRDLQLRTSPEHSAAQGLFFATLLSFLALSEIPAARWNARSRAVTLPERWQTFFSYVASGPPAHRLEELLALADAGALRFLGPEVSVAIEPADREGIDAGFVATSPRRPGSVRAGILVDAWLPASVASRSDDAALRDLVAIHGSELRVADAEFAGSLGRVVVADDGRVARAGGTLHDTLFALGPFTSLAEGGAFTRPRSDALPFRQNDRVAGAMIDALLGAAGVDAEASAAAPAVDAAVLAGP